MMENLVACLIFLGAVGVAIGICAFTRMHKPFQMRIGLFFGLFFGFLLLSILLTWAASNLLPSQGNSNWLVPTLYQALMSGFTSGLFWTGSVLLLLPRRNAESLLLRPIWLLPLWYRVTFGLLIVFVLGTAIHSTQVAIHGMMIRGFPTVTISVLTVFSPILQWSQVLFLSLLISSKLEFSTQGISYGRTKVARWNEIASYSWQRNTLKICLAGTGRSTPIDLQISSKYKEAVDRVLTERLPGRATTISEETSS